MLPKAVFRHEHLAANRQQLGRVAAESLGYRPDATGLRSYVVALLAVAAGGCAGEAAVLVDEFDGDTVEFGFTDVADVRRIEPRIAEQSGSTVVELSDIGGVAALGNRKHRGCVFDCVEFVNGLATDTVGRAVGIIETELGLQCFESSKKFIVNTVGD
ncbi:MAG: hypothetical protein J07HN6_00790 [Halonotius sp. J07HN6]|nr:MAG: hypothetical protein J07HN6_00790 [Halonotius sp. J07HN6]